MRSTRSSSASARAARLSDTKSDTRGIGAARRWVKSRFDAISKDCGGCLDIVTPSQVFTGKRTPQEGVEVMDVVAIQRGTTDPRARDRDHRPPGFAPHRRDGCHRRCARRQRRCVGRLRADRGGARAEQVQIPRDAGVLGRLPARSRACTAARSRRLRRRPGLEGRGRPQQRHRRQPERRRRPERPHTRAGVLRRHQEQRDAGAGEVPPLPRRRGRFALAQPRALHAVARRAATSTTSSVRMVYRTDRYGRGGDQTEFLAQGFPAVRVTESHEDYTHQHQDMRTENGVQLRRHHRARRFRLPGQRHPR